MKPYLKFFLLLMGILLLSAFLAPLLFDFLPFKFERIFNRLVMIFSLAALPFVVRIRRQTFLDYGLSWKRGSLSLLVISFASGLVILFLWDLLKIVFGVAAWSPAGLTVDAWLLRIGEALLAAFLIGLIEEFFFRGFVFYSLNHSIGLNRPASIMITSLFYSLVHFVTYKSPFVGPDPTFFDGLRLILAPFESLRHFEEIGPGILGLFIFGVILNGVLLSTKSLYGPIGLHAGCVFFLKLDGLLIDFLNHESFWVGSSKTYDGILVWIFFGSLYFMFQRIAKKAHAICNGTV